MLRAHMAEQVQALRAFATAAEMTLHVRLVTRYRVQLAQLTGDATEEFTGTRCPGAIGHAKVELLAWLDKDEAWLAGGAS